MEKAISAAWQGRVAGTHMDINTIQKMSQQEKLRVMEALWDSLIHQAHEPPSPSWHQEILASRQARIDSGEATLFPWKS